MGTGRIMSSCVRLRSISNDSSSCFQLCWPNSIDYGFAERTGRTSGYRPLRWRHIRIHLAGNPFFPNERKTDHCYPSQKLIFVLSPVINRLFLKQMIFLNEVPGWMSLLGAVLVVSSVLLTGIRKWVDGLPAEDSRRQRFSFLRKWNLRISSHKRYQRLL